MEAWSPGPGVISVGTPITFRATGSADTSVQGFEWDFDGDGKADATSQVSGKTSAAARVDHAYGTPGSWVPKVRTVDVNGLPSLWAEYAAGGAKQ